MKRKKSLILILLISIIFNLLLLYKLINTKRINNQVLSDYTDKTKEVNETLDIKNKKVEALFENYYSDKLTKLLNEQDLNRLAQLQYNYVLTANGNQVNSKVFYIKNNNNVKITLGELTNKEKLLPKNILLKGTITESDLKDDLSSHIKVHSLVSYTKVAEEDEHGKYICYEFKDVPKGTIITVTLSEILKYRLVKNDKLKLDDNFIEIIIP